MQHDHLLANLGGNAERTFGTRHPEPGNDYRRKLVLAGGERPDDGSSAHEASIGACASEVWPASARSTGPRPGWTLVSSAEVPTWQTVQ